MKKICYVTTVHHTLDSFIVPVAKWLSETTDWEITLISNPDEAFENRLPERIRFIPVKMSRGINFDGIGAMLKLAKIFREERFDLVQYSTPNASLYASLAAKLAGVPVRLYCQWGIAYVGFGGIKRKVFKGIEKLVCALSTRVEPDSYGNLRFSHQEGLYPESKGSVVWNGSACGVDLKKFDISRKRLWRSEIREQLHIPQDAAVFGFVGRITGDKGINELLAAFRNTLEQEPDAYLMVVGRLDKEESLEDSLYRWAQQEPLVVWCGYRDAVEQYMSAMDVCVLPSYREGFGVTVIEAEAMGVPVIVTDIPGPLDAMMPGVTGMVVPKGDADALADAMRTLIHDTALCNRYGAAGHDHVCRSFEQRKLYELIRLDRKKLLGEE